MKRGIVKEISDMLTRIAPRIRVKCFHNGIFVNWDSWEQIQLMSRLLTEPSVMLLVELKYYAKLCNLNYTSTIYYAHNNISYNSVKP